jgi:hypothetical protein
MSISLSRIFLSPVKVGLSGSQKARCEVLSNALTYGKLVRFETIVKQKVPAMKNLAGVVSQSLPDSGLKYTLFAISQMPTDTRIFQRGVGKIFGFVMGKKEIS